MTATPSLESTAAMPLMPAPPTPMKWTGWGMPVSCLTLDSSFVLGPLTVVASRSPGEQ